MMTTPLRKVDEIPFQEESERGCGMRKPGGLYLVTDPGQMMPCGRLPIRLTTCPTCNGGIKPSRGWTWIEPQQIIDAAEARCEGADDGYHCGACPLGLPGEHALKGKHGLLWIGEKFYATPGDWMREAIDMGVSRRIPALPKGFEIGTHYVYVAHRHGMDARCECMVDDGKTKALCETCKGTGTYPARAIFHVFKPQRVEYVCEGNETDDEIDKLRNRNITPVRVLAAEGAQR